MATELKRLGGARMRSCGRNARSWKRAATFFAKEGSRCRFRLIDAAKKEFPVQRLCKVLGCQPERLFCQEGSTGLPSRRQHEDMVLLAHIRSGLCTVERNSGQPAHDSASFAMTGSPSVVIGSPG